MPSRFASREMTAAFPAELVVMALPIESQGVFERAGIPVLFTGIGKVNAAYALTRRLADYRHAGVALPAVINFGTAGSRCFATGTLVECHAFVQRDMDVTGLGIPLGVTPFEELPARLEFPAHFPQLAQGLCGSGDSFAMAPSGLECEVLDMEAYALAKVCWLERVQFTAVKYVTDGADDAAGADWQSNLPRAAELFLKLYRQFAIDHQGRMMQ
jgi:adenosylhomocysteine nucleosidase